MNAPRLLSPSSSVSSEREEVSSRAVGFACGGLVLEGGRRRRGRRRRGEVRTSDDARDSIRWFWEGTSTTSRKTKQETLCEHRLCGGNVGGGVNGEEQRTRRVSSRRRDDSDELG